MDPVITLKKLTKVYDSPAGSIPVLKDVNLTVSAGEMVAIMGPSGCGKSTLLYVLGLLQRATSGEFFLDSVDALGLSATDQAALRRKAIGFVLQTCNLFENSTVYENLEIPMVYDRVPHRNRRERIEQALRLVNLSHRIHQPSNMLSGGEQQRVAIARALVNRPRVILADEPTGQLDAKTSQGVMNLFKAIIRKYKTAMVMVTHDLSVANQCDRFLLLTDGCLQAAQCKK